MLYWILQYTYIGGYSSYILHEKMEAASEYQTDGMRLRQMNGQSGAGPGDKAMLCQWEGT